MSHPGRPDPRDSSGHAQLRRKCDGDSPEPTGTAHKGNDGSREGLPQHKGENMENEIIEAEIEAALAEWSHGDDSDGDR
jgi:hypothetical protein